MTQHSKSPITETNCGAQHRNLTISSAVASVLSLSCEDKFVCGGSLLLAAGALFALTSDPSQTTYVTDEIYAARQLITNTHEEPRHVAFHIAQK